ncbi:hypothetical protein BDF20DRAFT_868765, partial [Mycotypha africana]|uniref:uncharacterized protein n=1 Tax=Mycotypha africana TaxID=64632 RepID=UPI0023002D09
MGTKGPDGSNHYIYDKAPTHAILGAISVVGVINWSIRVPRQPPKVRKIQGGKERKNSKAVALVNEPKEGNTTEHLLYLL